MDREQRITYMNSQIACAQIEAIGMSAANTERILNKEPPLYSHQDFLNLINQYGIHHNAVVSFLESV